MRYLAEFIGTMVLVLFGIGAWTFAGGVIGVVGVGLAFGFAFMTMYYIFSTTWGAHFNPAITFGKWVAGDITFMDGLWQVLCQFAGAIVGVLFVYIIAYNQIGVPGVFVLGQNGWGLGYGAEYNIWGVMLFELIASFVLVWVFLELDASEYSVAGVGIGLTLAVLVMIGLPISGGSFNPARSLAPALFLGGIVLKQVWLFLTIPMVGGLLAGLMRRYLPFMQEEILYVEDDDEDEE